MSASKAQQAITAQRRARALALKVAGVDYETIAQQLGYASRGAAYTDIDRALLQRKRDLAEGADLAAALELERLDAMERAGWAVVRRRHVLVSQGRVMTDDDGRPMLDDGPTLEAIDRLLKIQVRRAKLRGLDAPTKHEVVTIDAIEAEITKLRAEMDGADDNVGATQTRPARGVEGAAGGTRPAGR